MGEVLQTLWSTIEDRRAHPRAGSYTASLFEAGVPRIAQKVGEEAVETAVARSARATSALFTRWPIWSTIAWCCWPPRAWPGPTSRPRLAWRFK